MLKISTRFDGGAVIVHDLADPQNIRLSIRPDNASDFAQWFYFRLQGAAYQNCVMHFENVASSAYPSGWEDYQARASYDRQNWFCVPTRYENGVLTIEHTPLSNSVYYAYFEPYSSEQHLNLLGDAQGSGLCQIDDLGSTVEGRDINLLTIGNQVESDLKIWIIARQHPGETMAEWFIEGLPYIFVAGTEGVPGYGPRIAALESRFKAAFAAASPDFQDEHGYEKNRPGQADLSMATNWVGHTFDCLAYTLEMPFKDNHNLPDDDFGWNGQRSLRLGEAVLSAILNVLPELRP